MRVNNKLLEKIIIFVLIIICGLIIFKPKQNKEIRTYENVNQNKQFAMYIEKNNNYEIYNENSFPNIYRYHLNEEKSYCQDNKGTRLSNLITPNYDGSITVTSNKTAYCYLYFDEEFRGTGTELPKSESKGLSTEIKGDMYRYQGQATEEIDNYICFGTDDINKCKKDPDHYMYRIIGVEESGRIKVIKKEALNKTYQWHTDYVTDIKLPDSVFFKAINGEDFLDNPEYVPTGWKDKIDNNNWLYGDILEDETGAVQDSRELYKMESGKIVTNWNIESSEDDGGLPYAITWDGNIVYPKGTILYYKPVMEKWNDIIKSKVSLMYLSDYSYSTGDEAKCNLYHESEEYVKCKLSWMHIFDSANIKM